MTFLKNILRIVLEFSLKHLKITAFPSCILDPLPINDRENNFPEFVTEFILIHDFVE